MLTPSGSLFQGSRNMVNKSIGKRYQISLDSVHCNICSVENLPDLTITYPICLHLMHFDCLIDRYETQHKLGCPVCSNPPTTLLHLLITRLVEYKNQINLWQTNMNNNKHLELLLQKKEQELEVREMLLRTNEKTLEDECNVFKRKKRELIAESRELVKTRAKLRKLNN